MKKIILLILSVLLISGLFTGCDDNAIKDVISDSSTDTSPTNTTPTCIVTFNSNGGSTVTSQTVFKGEKASKPENPTKDGLRFDKWCSDSGFTTEFDFNTAIESDITLHAKWTNKNPSPSAPTISDSNVVSATTEASTDASISGVDTTMEYSTDGGNTWISVTGTKIENLGAGIVKIRLKETDTTLAGESADVDLRCEDTSVPSGLNYVAPTTIGGDDGKITGVSTVMEYSTDGGTTWTTCTGTEITGLSAGDVQIRYSETEKKKAGTTTTITVEDKVTISFDGNGATGSMPSVYVQKETSYTLPANGFTTPSGKAFSKWKVQGDTTEYSVGESLTVSADITLVAQWSDKASGPSAPTGIVRSASPSNPTSSDGVISGVTTTMEYSTDNGATWTDCTGTTISGLKAGKIQIRVKETATTLAGDITEFYLKVETSKISAPTGLYSTAPTTAGGSDGKISSATSLMEYSTDNGSTWTQCGSEITGLSAGTVKVRFKETDTTDAGQIADVEVKARYSISFVAGEHGSSTMSASSAVAGETYTVPACGFTADDGYEFNTWNDGTNDVAVGSGITVNANITLTAKWTPETYSITYKDKGNVDFTGTHESGYPTTHTYGTATPLKGATKDGCTFDGWYMTSSCDLTSITNIGATEITTNTTLYAKWTLPYLCFTANAPESTVALNKYGSVSVPDLETSIDDGLSWQEYIAGTTGNIELHNIGDKVYFRRSSDSLATQFSTGDYDYLKFLMTGSISASGNVMSLIDKTCQSTEIPNDYSHCFRSLFKGCSCLTTAPELPATKLTYRCYWEMFYGCESLTAAPELPATELSMKCYEMMFYGCKSLTAAPELPATELATRCYDNMFYGCESLTAAPELPATELATGCYDHMFDGCYSLTYAPELPATELQSSCYNGMFSSCKSLKEAPKLQNATLLADNCYYLMFANCTSLEKIPSLPNVDLPSFCCAYMFSGTNLKFSSSRTDECPNAYVIPSSGTAGTNWNMKMFYDTAGSFTGDPYRTTYYTNATVI